VAGECEQCHVISVRRKQNRDLFHFMLHVRTALGRRYCGCVGAEAEGCDSGQRRQPRAGTGLPWQQPPHPGDSRDAADRADHEGPAVQAVRR